MTIKFITAGWLAVLFIPPLQADDNTAPKFEAFTSKAGGFTALFPGTPKESRETIGKTADDKPVYQFQFAVESANGAYMVSYQDNPELVNADADQTRKLLEGGRNGAMKALKGESLKEKETKLDKHRGLEFEFTFTEGAYRSRIFLVKGRLYQVILVGTKDFVHSQDAEKFLRSFKLKSSDFSGSDQPLKLIKEAYVAAKTNLRSGFGTGDYSYYRLKPGEKDFVLRVKAKITVYFDDQKYHVRLDFEKNEPSRLEKRIIIYDQTAVLTSRFSKNIRPLFAEGDLTVPEANRGSSPHFVGEFPFDPRALMDEMVWIDKVLERFSSSLQSTKLSDGGYRFKMHVASGALSEFEVGPDSGFNVRSRKVYLNNERFLNQDYKAVWERSGDTWFVRSLDQLLNEPDGTSTRHVFSYDKFEPNVEVPSKVFQFAALELPKGSRIIDRRK